MAKEVLLVDQWGDSPLKKYEEVTEDNVPLNADLDWARANGTIGPMPAAGLTALNAVPSFDSDITPSSLEILAAGGDVQKATEEKAKKQREMIIEGRKVQEEALEEANKNAERDANANAERVERATPPAAPADPKK